MQTKNFQFIKPLVCKTFWYLFIAQALFIIYSVAPKKYAPIITLTQDFISLSGPNIIQEGETSNSYRITINEELTEDINVSLSYSGTAERNVDYVPIHTLVIKEGELFSDFTLQTLDDPYAEFNEELAIKIASINSKSFLNNFTITNPNNVIYTKILDEKNPKHGDSDTINISIEGENVLYEDSKNSLYTVNISQLAVEDIKLTLDFTGDAQQDIDYEAPKTITIKQGQKSANFTIKIINDIYKEDSEFLNLAIVGFDDIAYEDIRYQEDSFTIEIKDEIEPSTPLKVSLYAQNQAVETKKIKYTLKTEEILKDDITLVFTVIAKDSNIYDEKIRVTMQKGTQETLFELLVKDDNIIEKKQSITLELDSIEKNVYEHVQFNAIRSKTHIYDNYSGKNKSAQLSLSLLEDTKIYEDYKEFTVVVESSQTLIDDLKCTLTYTGSAENKKDFIAPHHISIKKGQERASFIIKLLNDNIIENENIVIHLKTRNNGGLEHILKTKPFSVTIEDEINPSNKQAAILSLTGAKQVSEGKKAFYILSLSQKLAADLQVNFSFKEEEAKNHEDFLIQKTFTMEKGLKRKKIFLQTVNNNVAENIESFTISLDSIQGGGLESILIDNIKNSITTSITDEIDIVNEFKKIVEKQKILFEYAKDSIDNKSFTSLDSIVLLLHKFPKALLTIEGHTDSSGNKYRNQKLSKRRANSVTQYLIKKGIKKSRLSSIGYGQYRPLVPDSNPNASKLNKRVGFKVKYKEKR